MLTSSFIFSKGMSEELERALWAHGLTSWELLRRHPEEGTVVLGSARCQRLLESVESAQKALAGRDLAWFRSTWPPRSRSLARLWQGFCPPERIALVDIETTGLTPGYDQITVIGLADHATARAFVAGRPQPGDEALDAFRLAIRSYDLVVTFNGTSFDLPFIERHFRDASFHIEQPHLDLMLFARSLGLGGGLKDMEKQLGIVRPQELQGMVGTEAIELWGRWRQKGELAAYQRLVSYCKTDCSNLAQFAQRLYRRRWTTCHAEHAKLVDFTRRSRASSSRSSSLPGGWGAGRARPAGRLPAPACRRGPAVAAGRDVVYAPPGGAGPDRRPMRETDAAEIEGLAESLTVHQRQVLARLLGEAVEQVAGLERHPSHERAHRLARGLPAAPLPARRPAGLARTGGR